MSGKQMYTEDGRHETAESPPPQSQFNSRYKMPSITHSHSIPPYNAHPFGSRYYHATDSNDNPAFYIATLASFSLPNTPSTPSSLGTASSQNLYPGFIQPHLANQLSGYSAGQPAGSRNPNPQSYQFKQPKHQFHNDHTRSFSAGYTNTPSFANHPPHQSHQISSFGPPSIPMPEPVTAPADQSAFHLLRSHKHDEVYPRGSEAENVSLFQSSAAVHNAAIHSEEAPNDAQLGNSTTRHSGSQHQYRSRQAHNTQSSSGLYSLYPSAPPSSSSSGKRTTGREANLTALQPELDNPSNNRARNRRENENTHFTHLARVSHPISDTPPSILRPISIHSPGARQNRNSVPTERHRTSAQENTKVDTLKEKTYLPRGRKRAVLVGINYIKKAERHNIPGLRGAINDAMRMCEFLKNHGSYTDQDKDDILILADDSPRHDHRPTRENIIRILEELVKNAEEGDELFFHYSGHGIQIPEKGSSGMTQCIIPEDWESAGYITDYDLYNVLVKPLPKGCKLTAVVDSCHSGTILDLCHMYSIDEQNQKMTRIGNDKYRATDADITLWSCCMDHEQGADINGNGLDVGAMSFAFTETLSQNSGHSYEGLLKEISEKLQSHNQHPVLSSSRPIVRNKQFFI